MKTTYNKEHIVSSSQSLYNDIDNCITELLRARVNKNVSKEQECLCKMESLTISTMQQLSVLIDYIEEKKN